MTTKITKKTVTKKVVSKKPSTNVIKVVPAPAVGAPTPPDGFDVTTPVPLGARPWTALTDNGGQVAAELAGSATFEKDFGAKQSASEMAAAIQLAAAWRRHKVLATHWLTYVRTQDAAAYRDVVKYLDRFRKAFEYAAMCDPTLRARYPQTDALYRARSQASLRAAATRAAKKAAKAAVDSPPTPVPPVPAAPAAKPVVTAADGPTLTAPVTVTVR